MWGCHPSCSSFFGEREESSRCRALLGIRPAVEHISGLHTLGVSWRSTSPARIYMETDSIAIPAPPTPSSTISVDYTP